MANKDLYAVIVRAGNTAKIFKGLTAQETTHVMGEYAGRRNYQVLAAVDNIEIYDKEGAKDIDE